MLTFIKEELEQYETDLSDMKIATFEKSDEPFTFEMSKDDGTEITYSVTLTGQVNAKNSTVLTDSCEFGISEDGTAITMTISNPGGLGFEKGDVIAFGIFGTFEIKGSDGSKYTANTEWSEYMIQYGTEGGDDEQPGNENDDDGDDNQDTDWNSVEKITMPEELKGLAYCGVINGPADGRGYHVENQPCMCKVMDNQIIMMMLDQSMIADYAGAAVTTLTPAEMVIIPLSDGNNVYIKSNKYTSSLAKMTISERFERHTDHQYELWLNSDDASVALTLYLKLTDSDVQLEYKVSDTRNDIEDVDATFKIYNGNVDGSAKMYTELDSGDDTTIDRLKSIGFMVGMTDDAEPSLIRCDTSSTGSAMVLFAIGNLESCVAGGSYNGYLDTDIAFGTNEYSTGTYIAGSDDTENIIVNCQLDGGLGAAIMEINEDKIKITVSTTQTPANVWNLELVPISTWVEYYGSE